MTGRAFPSSYQEARRDFRAALERRDAPIESRALDARGPDGSALSTDAAYFGPRDPDRLLVVTSGVHGTELLSGSGAQTRLIESGDLDRLPLATGVLLVHAINPWGAAHLRRNTERNVDLCRNFVDFEAAPPRNAAYEELRPFLDPPALEEITAERAMGHLRDLEARFGKRRMLDGLMGGQFGDPGGFSFGGASPSWSRQTLFDLVEPHARSASRTCLVDLHTGVGPWGYGTAVCLHRGAGLDRARRWFGPWVFAPRALPPDSPEGLFEPNGHSSDGYERAFGPERVTAIVLEYGTYPHDRVFPALIQDHWLATLGFPPGPATDRVKRELRETFDPSDPEWRESAWDRTRQVVRQALRGLADD